MTDQYRSQSDLLATLFKDDQPVESITAQDMRDLIISLGALPFGGIYTLVSAETTISSAGAYVKDEGTTQTSNLRNMDMPASNRLRYLGLVPYHFHIACSLSTTAAGNNKLLSFKLFHWDDSLGTGSVLSGSQVNRFIAVGADEGSTALHFDMMLEQNDYLELHVANLTDATDLTLTNFYLFAMGMSM